MYSGKVEFSFKFFSIDTTTNELLYEINTTIATTRILNGWADSNSTLDHTYHVLDSSMIIDSTVLDAIYHIAEAGEKLKVLWIDVDDAQ